MTEKPKLSSKYDLLTPEERTLDLLKNGISRTYGDTMKVTLPY